MDNRKAVIYRLTTLFAAASLLLMLCGCIASPNTGKETTPATVATNPTEETEFIPPPETGEAEIDIGIFDNTVSTEGPSDNADNSVPTETDPPAATVGTQPSEPEQPQDTQVPAESTEPESTTPSTVPTEPEKEDSGYFKPILRP